MYIGSIAIFADVPHCLSPVQSVCMQCGVRNSLSGFYGSVQFLLFQHTLRFSYRSEKGTEILLIRVLLANEAYESSIQQRLLQVCKGAKSFCAFRTFIPCNMEAFVRYVFTQVYGCVA